MYDGFLNEIKPQQETHPFQLGSKTTRNHILNKKQATIPNKARTPHPNLHSSTTSYHGCPKPPQNISITLFHSIMHRLNKLNK